MRERASSESLPVARRGGGTVTVREAGIPEPTRPMMLDRPVVALADVLQRGSHDSPSTRGGR